MTLETMIAEALAANAATEPTIAGRKPGAWCRDTKTLDYRRSTARNSAYVNKDWYWNGYSYVRVEANLEDGWDEPPMPQRVRTCPANNSFTETTCAQCRTCAYSN